MAVFSIMTSIQMWVTRFIIKQRFRYKNAEIPKGHVVGPLGEWQTDWLRKSSWKQCTCMREFGSSGALIDGSVRMRDTMYSAIDVTADAPMQERVNQSTPSYPSDYQALGLTGTNHRLTLMILPLKEPVRYLSNSEQIRRIWYFSWHADPIFEIEWCWTFKGWIDSRMYWRFVSENLVSICANWKSQ